MMFAFSGSNFGSGAWSQLRFSDDLPLLAQVIVWCLVGASLLLLLLEIRRIRSKGFLVFVSGALATIALALAVLRPVSLSLKGKTVPGYVLVLVDSSHRMDLPATDHLGTVAETRRELAAEAVNELKAHLKGARVVVRAFTSELLSSDATTTFDDPGPASGSDLLAALPRALDESAELPQAVIVISDGRMTRPGPLADEAWRNLLRSKSAGVPVHTIAVAEASPKDRSLRSIGFTGSAVAHQPFRLEVEVGCHLPESCDQVEVEVFELMERQPERLLARGEARGEGGRALLSLKVTLEQAGNRALLIRLVGDEPDAVVENDHRIIPVLVRRDRLRMLHVAGRPTYDVRALRRFLKSDESTDLISFFILRTESDQVQAEQDELALIPFPVDELFSDHLSSFDAVILQDIDARRYRLDRYFRSMKDYVIRGGGLVLVGGPTGFSSGGYAGSPLEDVLPVQLPKDGELIVRKPFVPQATDVGRAAPILRALRNNLGDVLPEMDGSNVLGAPKEGALVLWEHPTETLPARSAPEKMPILAVYEVGDGRSISLSVDGTHQLRFGELGAKTGGRAHADLWEGLLGWLMRDPRYESAQLQLEGPCQAGVDQGFSVHPILGTKEEIRLSLEKLGSGAVDALPLQEVEAGGGGARRFIARKIPEGGYAARVRVGAAPPSRTVIACEEGGEAWADSRPDAERLRSIAAATGGVSVFRDQIAEVPPVESSFVSAERVSHPVLSNWIWATLAVALMSIHWLIRRAQGHL